MTCDTYKSQRRGGRGIHGITTREEDFVEDLIITSTHDHILFFTNKGKVYSLKGYQIPEAGRQARGNAIVNLIEISSDESVTAVIPIDEYKRVYILLWQLRRTCNEDGSNGVRNLRKGG